MLPPKLGDLNGDLSGARPHCRQRKPRPQRHYQSASAARRNATYANDLISKTQGRATYSMEFSHYDYVPNELAEKVIAAHKGRPRRTTRRGRSLVGRRES